MKALSIKDINEFRIEFLWWNDFENISALLKYRALTFEGSFVQQIEILINHSELLPEALSKYPDVNYIKIEIFIPYYKDCFSPDDLGSVTTLVEILPHYVLLVNRNRTIIIFLSPEKQSPNN